MRPKVLSDLRVNWHAITSPPHLSRWGSLHTEPAGRSRWEASGIRFSPQGAQSPHTDLSSDSEDDPQYSSQSQLLGRSSLVPGHRRFPSADEDDSDKDNDHDGVLGSAPAEERPVTWSSLPKKGQLAILTFVRLSEPLTQTSLQAYMFYQLKSFDESLPNSTISAQAGILQGSFTAAQFLTAVWWGRLADAEWMGRKRVLLIGLLGTCISCLGFGFSRSFAAAAVFRTLGGVLNSNVGVMRTLIAEIIVEKKYQSRAFLLLPMCFNVGVIIGPILGGSLADPVHNLPHLFGPGSVFGGKDGVWWMQHWPYALPNVLSAIFIFLSLLAAFLGLEEVRSSDLPKAPPEHTHQQSRRMRLHATAMTVA